MTAGDLEIASALGSLNWRTFGRILTPRPDLSSIPAANPEAIRTAGPRTLPRARVFCCCTYDSPPIGRARGLLALQLAVEKEDGGQLHQVAEAEVDHVQGADAVQGEGALAVGKDGRPQQQKQQQPVGGVGGGVRFSAGRSASARPPGTGSA